MEITVVHDSEIVLHPPNVRPELDQRVVCAVINLFLQHFQIDWIQNHFVQLWPFLQIEG